jgi:hypothetical protein
MTELNEVTMRMHNQESGTTMIETIMYICIMLVLGTTLAGYMSKAFSRYKTGRVAQQVIELQKAIVSFTAADENYSYLCQKDGYLSDYTCPTNRPTMETAGAMPLDMRLHTNAFGGRIEFGCVANTDNGYFASHTKDPVADKYLFFITFKGIPKPACIEVLVQNQYHNNGVDLDTLTVNDRHWWNYEYSSFTIHAEGSSVTTTKLSDTAGSSDAAVKGGILPTVKDAADACNKTTDNTITWIFS